MFHNRVLILGDNFRMSSSGSAHAIPVANKHPNETHSLLRTHECYCIKNVQMLPNKTIK
ncbi:hypothetical protein ALC62_07733 [Cyphomyrmex costatus]|uniref:Uncharacterized protein n=1 Tax=Cyphomyrmex costatus TaxID=456900 RepID=A0A195CLF5_9HYME|nr:hypothetical protein ALC62_07733 [Cyphomyrmex costatus]